MTNAYNATDGDNRKTQQYSLHFDAALNDRLDFSAKGYFNRLDDDRYVKFSAGASQQRRERTSGVHLPRCTIMQMSATFR